MSGPLLPAGAQTTPPRATALYDGTFTASSSSNKALFSSSLQTDSHTTNQGYIAMI
jgi:hypothetical protein